MTSDLKCSECELCPKSIIISTNQDEHLSSSSEAYRIEENHNFGKHLVAARTLLPQDVILREKPCFYGPMADFVEDFETPLCLSCCVVMNDGNEASRCEKCHWPLCSRSCDNICYHLENECRIFSSRKIPFPPEGLDIQQCYKCVVLLRGLLLKEKDLRLWNWLMTIQHETELPLETQPDLEKVRESFGLLDYGELQDWAKIFGIINVNSYSVQRMEKSHASPTYGEFVYPVQSLMAHSCAPNCTLQIDYSPEFTIVIKPNVKITSDEMLTVSYSYLYTKYGFSKRRKIIQDVARFNCRCTRCQDNTDLGVNCDAVMCFKCKIGLILPPFEGDKWTCKDCGYSTCSEFVTNFVQGFQDLIDIGESDCEEFGESYAEFYDDFFSQKSNSSLHSNHWLLMELASKLASRLSEKVDTLTKDEVGHLLSYSKYLLTIKNTLAPGRSPDRGLIHQYIARGLYRKLFLEGALSEGSENELRILALNKIQKCAIQFWLDNIHLNKLLIEFRQNFLSLLEEEKHVEKLIQKN